MKKKRWLDGVLYVGFAFYILLLLRVVVFKYVMPWGLLSEERYFSRTVNLVPFSDVINGNFTTLDIYGNILIFIPLGIYFSVFFSKTKVYVNLLKVILVSLTIELLQYILAIGAADTTDIITNTAGGLAGIGIYMGIRLIAKSEAGARKAVTLCSMVTMMFTIIIVSLLFIAN